MRALTSFRTYHFFPQPFSGGNVTSKKRENQENKKEFLSAIIKMQKFADNFNWESALFQLKYRECLHGHLAFWKDKELYKNSC